MKLEEFNRIKEVLIPFFSETKVLKVIMFGSGARGSDTRKSDLDLMIVMETEKRFFDRYEQFDRIHSLIREKSVDLLIYTPLELHRIAHRPFIKNILDTGLILYEC